MAGYRQFHTKFWKDEWLIELEPLERYLFTYLFTNELSSISGLYKLPMKVIENETALDKKFITKTFAKFEKAKKIFYRDSVMWVVKMREYHKNASPTTMIKVNNDVASMPYCEVKKAYLYYEKTGEYHIDTVSIPILRRESLSLSLNESEKESSSESKAKTDFSPTFSPDLSSDNIFTQVTGYTTIPGSSEDKNNVRSAIQSIARQQKENTIPYLKPFFKTFQDKYPASTKTFWLTDWSVTGKMPEKGNGHKSSSEQDEYNHQLQVAKAALHER
jgi:hypothetical protein